MQFDREAYREFLTQHGKAKTEPAGLLERYAITLSRNTSDDEVRDHLKAVRAYWNQHANGNARISRTAKWCRDRDAELRSEHGGKLDTAAWWREAAAAEARKAQAAVQALTASLAEDYGHLGVVAAANAAAYGSRQGLSAAQAIQAARQAGLHVIDEKVRLPDRPPINPTQFNELVQNLKDGQVKTIPELLHPGSGTFAIVERYDCKGNPALRLDEVAIRLRRQAAGKAINAANTARGEALAKLSNALGSGVDLDVVALYHLTELVKDAPATVARRELIDLRVEATDAAIIAALLDGRQQATQVNRADQVRSLLAEGELREAESQASMLPDGHDKAYITSQIAARRRELSELLAKAEAARRQSDEAQAEKHLRAAGMISRADADEMLRQLPLAPPGLVTATGDEASVKVFWQRGPGHDESTVYAVARTEGRAPAAAGDGTQVHWGTGTECADAGAPAARPIQYGVFATASGRPPSRPGVVTVTPKPPVWGLQAEAGIGAVTLSWQAKPEARVLVTRAAGGAAPVPVPVSGSSVQLRDLPDGITQVFEVVAVYRGADGAELRSLTRTVSATPRAGAKPNDTLQVDATQADGRLRVRARWRKIDTSEVSILLTAGDQPWPFRTVISPDEAERGGTLLKGIVEISGADRILEVELPAGIHYLTPLSKGGTGVAVGLSRPVAIIDPVTNLDATVFTDHAIIAWRWPASVQLAKVSWRPHGDAAVDWESDMLSRAEYQSNGGLRVSLGPRPIDVEVRAVMTANGNRHLSAPATTFVAKVTRTPIRYRVSRGGPFGGRSRKVTFTADEPCQDTVVRILVAPGTVMPTRPDKGHALLPDITLSLAPGVPDERKVELPKDIKKPYWVRCFVISGPGRLVDPPTGDLKEG